MIEKTIKNNKNKEIAIKVENLSKTFRIPHEKETTLKGAAVNLFNAKIRGKEIFHALQDVNFEVKKGEFFGIIGRNGCGKSTLLKVLAGIYIPDKNMGLINIVGKLSPFLELGVGFNPELTGRENIFLGGTILGLTKKQIAERYEGIVEFAELEEFIDMKLKNYSSGMQVRLAFSLSINVDAEILLMDEVLAVGDTNFQAKCIAEFNKHKEMGKTVVLVTHDINTVKRYCDRAMLLRSGKIVEIGHPEDVANTYTDQNMSDEERRISLEQDSQVGKTNGEDSGTKKVAEIMKFEFFDKNGKPKNVFATGDDLLIRVHYKKNGRKVKEYNFGIGIYTDEDMPVFGTTTFLNSKKKIDFEKSDTFSLLLKNVKLKNGTYHARAAIWGADQSIVYDGFPKSRNIRFFSKSQTDGFMEIDYTWE